MIKPNKPAIMSRLIATPEAVSQTNSSPLLQKPFMRLFQLGRRILLPEPLPDDFG